MKSEEGGEHTGPPLIHKVVSLIYAQMLNQIVHQSDLLQVKTHTHCNSNQVLVYIGFSLYTIQQSITFVIEEKMKKVLLISFLLFFFTTTFAGISTQRQDILKLIGTTYAPNGKFAWIELNGEDYGWTREGRNVGKYRIVMVEMGKVKLELFGRVVELKLLPEDAQWDN